MRKQLEALLKALRAGSPAELVTIIERQGSSPRGVGAAMLITPDGKQTETIGGGSVEYQAKLDSLELLKTRSSGTAAYVLHPNEAADIGMVCGGRIRVVLRCFRPDAETVRLVEDMLEWMRTGREAYLICPVRPAGVGPSEAFLVDGIDNLPKQTREAVEPFLGARPVLTQGETRWLVEPLLDAPRVIVFGGGHVSQKLVPLLNLIDYRVWVVEDRAEFADPDLFPAADRVIHHSFEAFGGELELTSRDHAVVMTRGHQADYAVLRQLLRTQTDYIGCIGSRQKVALTREKLLAEGFAECDIDRIHAPVGLPIGAETPAEIAVSVAAELIAYCAEKKKKRA